MKKIFLFFLLLQFLYCSVIGQSIVGVDTSTSFSNILVSKGSDCVIDLCNMINNGGFESSNSCGLLDIYGASDCWSTYSGTPDLISRNCNNSFGSNLGISTWNSTPPTDSHNPSAHNDHIIGLWTSSGLGNESIKTSLNAPLLNGHEYTISFWAKVNNGFSKNDIIDRHIKFCTGNNTSQGVFPGSLNLLSDFEIHNDGKWWNCTKNFTFNNTTGITQTDLIIGIDRIINSGSEYYVFIDDIQIVPTELKFVGTPSTLCSNSLINLNQYLNPGSVHNGKFTCTSGTIQGNGSIDNNGNPEFDYIPASGTIGWQNIIYTYTTSTSDCEKTISFQIYVSGNITLIRSNNNPICPGESVFFSVYGPVGTNYEWNNCTTCTTLTYTITPSADITFPLNYSNLCGNFTIPITVNLATAPVITVSPINQTICAGQSVKFTLSGAANNSYVWTSSTGQTFRTNGNNYTLTPSASETYTIASEDDGCLLNVVKVVITVNQCSDPGYSKCTTDEVFGIDEIKDGGTYSAGNYSISNPVTIPVGKTLVFIDAEVMIQKGASIIVQNGASLIIRGSHFYGCDEMWQGIEVEPGGLVQITGSKKHSSFIEDAIVAVHFDMKSKNEYIELPKLGYFLSVDNTIFNRNNISISIENYTLNSTRDYPFYVKNTVFTSRAIDFVSGKGVWNDVLTLKNSNIVKATAYPNTPNGLVSPYIVDVTYPYDGIASFMKTPLNNMKPFAGIVLNNVGYSDNEGVNTAGITIGYSYRDYDPELEQEIPIELKPNLGGGLEEPQPHYKYNTSFNLFDNMDNYGIYAVKSNLKSVNNTFQKGYLNEKEGNVRTKGIFAENDIKNSGINKLEVITEKPGITPNNAFFDQTYAIRSNYYVTNTINNTDIRSTHEINDQTDVGVFGIDIFTDRMKSVEVNGNHIYNIRQGIVLNSDLGGAQSGPVNINENYFDICVPSAKDCNAKSNYINCAINLDALNYQNTREGAADLNCNNNEMYNVHNGIYASNWNMKNTIFDYNKVTMVEDPNGYGGDQYGIHVDGGVALSNGGMGNASLTNKVTNNDVTGYTGTTATAIDLNSNSGLYVGCNIVKKATNGIRFNGNTNHNNKCWDNTFDANNTYGLTMDDANNSQIDMGGLIPRSDGVFCTADNVWINDWDITGNYKTACVHGSDALQLPMCVRAGTIYNPYAINGVNYNYFDGQNSTPYSSPISIDVETPDGNCTHDCTHEEYERNTASKMHSKGITNNFGGNNNKITYAKGGTLSQLERIALGKVLINTADSAQRLYVMQQQLYASLMADSSLSDSSTILLSFRDSASQGSLGTIYTVDTLFAAGKIAAANNILTNWMPLNNVDLNYYQYYQCLVDKADTNKGLNALDSSTVFRLAFGCPQTDGKVVFAARNLFRSLTNLYFNFPNTCSRNYQMRKEKKEISKKNTTKEEEIVVYPNPSKGNVNIKLPVNGRWQITATDITGRIVWQQACDGCNGIMKHEFKNSKGLYFIKVTNTNTGQQSINKIILQ